MTALEGHPTFWAQIAPGRYCGLGYVTRAVVLRHGSTGVKPVDPALELLVCSCVVGKEVGHLVLWFHLGSEGDCAFGAGAFRVSAGYLPVVVGVKSCARGLVLSA